MARILAILVGSGAIAWTFLDKRMNNAQAVFPWTLAVFAFVFAFVARPRSPSLKDREICEDDPPVPVPVVPRPVPARSEAEDSDEMPPKPSPREMPKPKDLNVEEEVADEVKKEDPGTFTCTEEEDNEWTIVEKSVDPTEMRLALWLRQRLRDMTGPGTDMARQPLELLRFLRACRGDVPEAAEMLRRSISWRGDRGIEEKHKSWTAELDAGSTPRAKKVLEHAVHAILGRDRLGLPVYIFRWSVFDIDGAEKTLGSEVVCQIILSIHEQVANELRRQALESGSVLPGALFIWDIGDYGKLGVPNWHKRMLALVRFLPRISSHIEANYPEVVRKIMVIRSSHMTKLLYRAASPFLPEGTLRKCRLYGWYAKEWRHELESEMPGVSIPGWLRCERKEDLANATPKGGIYV